MTGVRQREPRLVIPALTQLAKDKPCMFRVPGVCNGRTDTTVWCHSNEGRHGKGMGTKSHDIYGAFGCSACHDWYDTKSRIIDTLNPYAREDAFRLAFERTLYYLWSNGYITVHRRG